MKIIHVWEASDVVYGRTAHTRSSCKFMIGYIPKPPSEGFGSIPTLIDLRDGWVKTFKSKEDLAEYLNDNGMFP